MSPEVTPRFKAPKVEKARKPLRAKPKSRTEAEKAIRQAVFDRDGGCLLAGYSPCFGGLTPHHRRKAGQGGGYTYENLATLCQHHNDEIEADAELRLYCVAIGMVVLTTFESEAS